VGFTPLDIGNVQTEINAILPSLNPTHIFYRLAWAIVLPLALARLIIRSIKVPLYRADLSQRFGGGNVSAQSPIWIHAVSVGETRAAQPLVLALQARFPTCPILLTQTTATGRETARTLFGPSVERVWLPWDAGWCMRRFLSRRRPLLCILLETELWPTLIAECNRRHIPVVLANGRLSRRSAKRYARWPSISLPMLCRLTQVAAQTKSDAVRFRALGAVNVTVTGNLKFDNLPLPEKQSLGLNWRTALNGRRTVLLASTRAGEEALLLDAFHSRLAPDVLLILVPRHPDRFDQVAAELEARGLSFARRSGGRLPDPRCRVWLGDSMGEMFAWYTLADVAVIGGSWLPLGGQNLIEACAAGSPVIVGRHTFNFAQATEDALAAGAALRVADAAEAAEWAEALLEDGEQRTRMSAAGIAFAHAHRGAAARNMALIEPLIESALAELRDSNL
jgi:3-deoxy-D-manno-octulosonic-acid transferase